MINAFSQTFRRKTPSSFRLNHKSLKKWSVWCTFGQLRFRISGFTWRWKQLASETLRIVSYILTTVESSSTFTWPCIVYVFFQVQPTRCNVIQHSLLLSMLYMFRTVSPPIIRSSKTAHTASGICQACLLLLKRVHCGDFVGHRWFWSCMIRRTVQNAYMLHCDMILHSNNNLCGLLFCVICGPRCIFCDYWCSGQVGDCVSFCLPVSASVVNYILCCLLFK